MPAEFGTFCDRSDGMSRNIIRDQIAELMGEFRVRTPDSADDDTRLIGDGAVVTSRGVVELLFALEEFAPISASGGKQISPCRAIDAGGA